MESAALVHREGSIDWLCLPRFDSPWIFGRMLDWNRGGYLRVAAEHGSVAGRQYRTGSNVLETTWINGRDQAQVIDFMPVHPARQRRRAPQSLRLLRLIQPVRGALRWRIEFRPAFDYGRATARFTEPAPGLVVARAGSESAALEYPQHFDVARSNGTAVIEGSLDVGQTAVIALHRAARYRRRTPVSWNVAEALLEATDHHWRSWLQQCTYQGAYAPLVRRSALVLKLLQYQPSGAFVAAPTTSLPEVDGGTLNWDYRYTWLRDMSTLVDTLSQLGFVEEIDQFLEWLDERCDCEPSAFQMLYRVDGDPNVEERELRHLPGYRGSQPVRVGNAAADQKQLDVYGEVMEAAHAAWKRDRHMPRRRRAILLQVVDHVLTHWEEPDAGIWESRTGPRRYVYSQAMCWLALDRALRMDSALRLGRIRRAEARRIRTRIRHEVLVRGFNASIGAFTQAFDDDTLDAAGLTVPLTGMLPAKDPRVAATVDAVKRQLTREGLVYRHVEGVSGFEHGEGAFLVCSFWLVDVLAQMGRNEEAAQLFARVSRTANDLGLFAEEYEPRSGTAAGNFPLALSHLSMLGAVINMDRGTRRRVRQ
jgi:GH15 family glucan-1,4-alpha-glucosidase